MKLKISKAEFDKLSDAFKAVYKADEKNADVYHLEVEDAEDTTALKNAKEHEKNQRKKVEQELADLKAQMAKEKDEALKKGGDIAALEKSWQDKLAAKETELRTEADGYVNQLRTILVDNVAVTLAGKLSKTPGVLLPHIKARLTVEKDETTKEFRTRILGPDGKPSASSLADLEKEFLANKDFSAIVIGSRASGGGAGGAGSGSGGTGNLDYTKATAQQIAADLKSRGLAETE